MNLYIKMMKHVISTDKNDIDVDKLYNYLSFKAYWSKNRSRDIIEKSINNSLNFSLLEIDNNVSDFIGFARIITDFSTFAYLADVYIDKKRRGIGLGKFLIKYVMNEEKLKGIRSWVLKTKDAHSFYQQLGWISSEDKHVMIYKPKL